MKRSLLLTIVFLLAYSFTAGCSADKKPAGAAGGGAAAASSADAQTVVAVINGERITLADLDKSVKAQLLKLEASTLDQRHQIRTRGLENLVAKKLVLAEAAKRGTTEEGLLQTEVMSKIKPPTEQEMKAFYDANTQRINQPYDQVKDRIHNHLMQQQQQQLIGQFIDGLRSAAKVELTPPAAELPFVEVAAVGPSRGPDKAPVTLLIFSDFECPYCSRAKPVLDQIRQTYGDKVRMVFRDYPLPFHQKAQKAAEAALCADAQGKFWEMHDQLFTNQTKLEVADLKAHARQLGLDGGKFDACLENGDMAKKVADNIAAGEDAGVEGTPAFFINGRMLTGAQPFERFKEAIDQELKRAGA